MTLSNATEIDTLRGWLVRKLLRNGYVCKKHIDIDDIPKGANPRYRKDILKLVDDLKKSGRMFSFPHGSKEKCCLNRRFIAEFEEILRRYESRTKNP